MCSIPHWQVGLSWFHEKLSPANREQRLSRWADFAKNCLPRIGSKELPRFREKYRALGRQKNGVQHATAIYPIPRYTRPRYIGLTLYISFIGMSDNPYWWNTATMQYCVYMMKWIFLQIAIWPWWSLWPRSFSTTPRHGPLWQPSAVTRSHVSATTCITRDTSRVQWWHRFLQGNSWKGSDVRILYYHSNLYKFLLVLNNDVMQFAGTKIFNHFLIVVSGPVKSFTIVWETMIES